MTTQEKHWHRRFLMKDIFDRGQFIALGAEERSSYTTEDVLASMDTMDQAFGADGKPNYDLHIWMGLGRLMLNVGDVALSAVRVHVKWNREIQQADSWNFCFELSEDSPLLQDIWAHFESREWYNWSALEPAAISPGKPFQGCVPQFVTFTNISEGTENETLESVIEKVKPTAFPVKAMGAVDPKQYIARLNAYPLSVHPAMAARSLSNFHYTIISFLRETGLTVREHWFPEDTAEGFARYLVSDGLEHYLLDFFGPLLSVYMAYIDEAAGRDADDGAVILDAKRQEFAVVDDNPDLPF